VVPGGCGSQDQVQAPAKGGQRGGLNSRAASATRAPTSVSVCESEKRWVSRSARRPPLRVRMEAGPGARGRGRDPNPCGRLAETEEISGGVGEGASRRGMMGATGGTWRVGCDGVVECHSRVFRQRRCGICPE